MYIRRETVDSTVGEWKSKFKSLENTTTHIEHTSLYILHTKPQSEVKGLSAEGTSTTLYSLSSYKHFY
jgi:hypothetical protein